MHIAVQNAFPNLSVSAEREFIARLHLAGRELGWRITDVVTSDDILACAPDMVLATHEFTPKLTRFPTLGVIWSPLEYFATDPARIRNILSYDGCLVATEGLREWTRGLFEQYASHTPISPFDFLPTAIARPGTEFPSAPRLFYAGVHWDGARHGDLFKELEGRCPMRIFGKPERWEGCADYAGTLPFDGTALGAAIAECGIALAIHTNAHRAGDTPSMRLFEAAAAGAVIIADRIPFALRSFDDAVLWIETDRPTADVAAQIVRHVKWVRANPVAAADMARRAYAIFCAQFDLREQMARLPDFLRDVGAAQAASPPGIAGRRPLVEVILRVGSRPVERVCRAIESLVAQTYPDIGLIVVKFRDVPGLDAVLARHAPRVTHVRVVEVPDNGLRSGALWAGLQSTQGDYLGNLDDDDAVHPTHIAGLVRALQAAPAQVPLVYSGTIEVQEEDGHWFDQPNFRGDLDAVIPERRRLRFMDSFSAEGMRAFRNVVSSNSWLLRRSALIPDILVDPKVRVVEDVFLYLMLMRRGPLQLVPAATAEWFWRSSSQDNSMFADSVWIEDFETVKDRLRVLGALPPDLSGWPVRRRLPSPASEPEPVAPQPQKWGPVHRVLRRPSLLLGPLAPAWRRLRNRLRG